MDILFTGFNSGEDGSPSIAVVSSNKRVDASIVSDRKRFLVNNYEGVFGYREIDVAGATVQIHSPQDDSQRCVARRIVLELHGEVVEGDIMISVGRSSDINNVAAEILERDEVQSRGICGRSCVIL